MVALKFMQYVSLTLIVQIINVTALLMTYSQLGFTPLSFYLNVCFANLTVILSYLMFKGHIAHAKKRFNHLDYLSKQCEDKIDQLMADVSSQEELLVYQGVGLKQVKVLYRYTASQFDRYDEITTICKKIVMLSRVIADNVDRSRRMIIHIWAFACIQMLVGLFYLATK